MGSGLFNFTNFWRSLSGYSWWQVVIELFLIGIVVYVAISFLRGTRGARLLRGMALAMIVLYLVVKILANGLHLERIAFLYDRFVTAVLFIAIIVFQPELRRALMRLGETRLFRGWTNQLSDEIEALVEASSFLSKRKIGALIAIERDVGLGGVTENGTKLNADLTADLIETIFWPNSPLHDLGVIISQGRVAYAGVQFPLAEVGELDRELGSRHRAAVGMSQESDAVILIVSEETGDVSVAERGQLIRKLTPEGLRKLLTELLGSGEIERFSRD